MRHAALLLTFALLIGACRGSRPDGDGAPGLSEESIDHAAYEDFDPAPYEEAAVENTPVEHDVPASLMNNRPETGGTRTAEGFRVQITQTQSKAAADALVGEATAWWREQGGNADAPAYFQGAGMPVYVAYRQPYYRVRLGNFTTQAEAQRAASRIARRFPGASVVRDTVTLPR